MSRKLRVSITYRITKTIRVDAPDGPLTPKQINAILDAAVAEADPDADDVEAEIIDDYDKVPPPDASPDVPDTAWTTVGAHRYATTGSIIVREDGPRPASLPPGTRWQTYPDYGTLFENMKPITPAVVQWFDGRYAPLLSGATMYRSNGFDLAVTFDDDGIVVSGVAPLRSDVQPCSAFPTVVSLTGDVREVSNG